MRLKNFHRALDDAESRVKLRPASPRSFECKAAALFGLNRKWEVYSGSTCFTSTRVQILTQKLEEQGMDAQRLSDSILKLNSSRYSVYWYTNTCSVYWYTNASSVYWYTHTCCTRTTVPILTPEELRCSKDGNVTEAAREAERAAVRNNLAALWHSESSQTSGEQACLHDLGVSDEHVRRGEGNDLDASHSHQPLPRQEMQGPRCSVYLLYKYKSTKPDARAA